MPKDTSSSPTSAEDSSQPRTPPLPQAATLPEATNADLTSDISAGGKKRKQQRRVNTAERRATHNMVERQRRENLNGRFLDLAAILPNLSQIRRPSKSAIVNSSIAYYHASRRHRHLAAREIRLLKYEVDALRREVNDWRDRAGIHRVQEPTRSEGFSIILSGELEILPIDGLDDEDGEEGENDLYSPGTAIGTPDDSFEHPPFDMPSSGPIRKSHQNVNPHPQGYNPDYFMQGQMARGMPMIASPGGTMVAENPDMPYQGMGGVSYPPPYPEMDPSMQSKWGPNRGNDQSFFGSFERRRPSSERESEGDNRRMSPRGRASPPGTPPQYFEQGWNGMNNGMNNGNMGGNPGMGNTGGVQFGMM